MPTTVTESRGLYPEWRKQTNKPKTTKKRCPLLEETSCSLELKSSAGALFDNNPIARTSLVFLQSLIMGNYCVHAIAVGFPVIEQENTKKGRRKKGRKEGENRTSNEERNKQKLIQHE